MGEYLHQRLQDLRSHPTVGDIRGKGLMQGIEFVQDKETKEPLDPNFMFWVQLFQEALDQGMFIESSGGCDRGQAGDMAMFGPPFIVTKEEIDEMVELFGEILSVVERRLGLL
jgi:adenosylmethionine-8-amino-7-oxononanoate aminotransferase